MLYDSHFAGIKGEIIMYDRDRGRDRNSGGDREMHKAQCSDCKAECEVPFKPSESRPVYCRDCYQKHRPPKRDRY
jgi:CxxC-x17-CxxC domain-containing protein